LTRKDQHFSWGVEADNVFQSLEASFMIDPLLICANLFKPFVLETDTFDFAIGVVFSQLGKNNLLHIVNFYYCKFFPIEINYNIHKKELLAIVDAFEEWCHLLEGVQHEITMYPNYKNLQYFMTSVLNRHQAWWALSWFQFQFVITYHLEC
jgi:hypothetical protein